MTKIKNKKMSKKKWIRRRRRIKKLILLGLIVLIAVLLVSCVAKLFGGKEESVEEPQKVEKTEEELRQEEKQKEIDAINQAAKEAGATEDVLELIAKNEETMDFVKNFAEKKDLPPAETIGVELVDGEIPHLLQWDDGWGYQAYGESTIASAGCGPTCMSMVIAGLTGDTTLTPYVMAEFAKESGYMIDGGGTYAAFMEYAAEEYGLIVTESHVSEDFVVEELTQGHPIVCNLAPGEHFTDVGHFIILTGYEDGMLSVNDPFSIVNTEKKWSFSDFSEQVIGMWSYAKQEAVE